MVTIDIDVSVVDNIVGYAACFVDVEADPITGPYTLSGNILHAYQYTIYKCVEYLNGIKKNFNKLIVYTYSDKDHKFDLFDGPHKDEIKKAIDKIEITFVMQNILDKSFSNTLQNRYDIVHKLSIESSLFGKCIFIGLKKKKKRKNIYKIDTCIDNISSDMDELNINDKIEIRLPSKNKRKKKGFIIDT